MPVAGSKRVRKPTAVSTEEEFPDEEDVIKEVHRDEEYGEHTPHFTPSKRTRTSY